MEGTKDVGMILQHTHKRQIRGVEILLENLGEITNRLMVVDHDCDFNWILGIHAEILTEIRAVGKLNWIFMDVFPDAVKFADTDYTFMIIFLPDGLAWYVTDFIDAFCHRGFV